MKDSDLKELEPVRVDSITESEMKGDKTGN